MSRKVLRTVPEPPYSKITEFFFSGTLIMIQVPDQEEHSHPNINLCVLFPDSEHTNLDVKFLLWSSILALALFYDLSLDSFLTSSIILVLRNLMKMTSVRFSQFSFMRGFYGTLYTSVSYLLLIFILYVLIRFSRFLFVTNPSDSVNSMSRANLNISLSSLFTFMPSTHTYPYSFFIYITKVQYILGYWGNIHITGVNRWTILYSGITRT